MAVRFSVDDFVVNRFFTEVASCVSVRFSALLELEAPGVIVVSCGSPRLASLLVFPSRSNALVVLQVEEQEGQLPEGCPMSLASVSVVFRQVLEGFLLASCARRFVVRLARTQLLHLF